MLTFLEFYEVSMWILFSSLASWLYSAHIKSAFLKEKHQHIHLIMVRLWQTDIWLSSMCWNEGTFVRPLYSLCLIVVVVKARSTYVRKILILYFCHWITRCYYLHFPNFPEKNITYFWSYIARLFSVVHNLHYLCHCVICLLDCGIVLFLLSKHWCSYL
jgi:hypothetical protein